MRNNIQNMLNAKPRQTLVADTTLRSDGNRPVNGLERNGVSSGVLDSFPCRTMQGLHAETEPFALEAATSRDRPSVLKLYLREIGQLKQLSREEEIALARRIQNGDEAARELMIKSNLRLVVKIAHQFDNMGLPLLDLISEGNIGLMKAVEHYDPAKGAKLSVYASYWIRACIYRALSNHARIIRLPVHVWGKLRLINSATIRLQELLGREPSDEEVAQEVGLASANVKRMCEASQSPVSLDATLSDPESRSRAEMVPDESALTPCETLDRSAIMDQAQRLHEVINQLKPRERVVLQFRFGLDGEDERTLEEIGRRFGLTRERIRQIQNKALAKLRKKICHQASALPAADCNAKQFGAHF